MGIVSALTWASRAGLAVAALAAMPVSARTDSTKLTPRLDVDMAALDRDVVMIGGGVGLVPAFEGAGEYILLPIGGFHGRFLGINVAGRGNQLAVDVLHHFWRMPVTLHVGPAINVNYTRSTRFGDARVRALGQRDTAIEAGVFASLVKDHVLGSNDGIAFNVAFLRDANGVHDSYVIAPSVDYGIGLGRSTYVNLSATAALVGDRYARTYYAVDAAGSARSGLPIFANPRGGLKSLSYAAVLNRAFHGPLGDGLGAFMLVSYSQLQGDFAASPVVSVAGDREQWFGAVGLGYTF